MHWLPYDSQCMKEAHHGSAKFVAGFGCGPLPNAISRWLLLVVLEVSFKMSHAILTFFESARGAFHQFTMPCPPSFESSVGGYEHSTIHSEPLRVSEVSTNVVLLTKLSCSFGQVSLVTPRYTLHSILDLESMSKPIGFLGVLFSIAVRSCHW